MSSVKEEKYDLSKELTDKYPQLNEHKTKKGRLNVKKKKIISKIITDEEDKIKFNKFFELSNSPPKQKIKESPKKKLKIKDLVENTENNEKKVKKKQLLKNKNLSNNKMVKTYSCKICGADFDQKSHHDAHLKTKCHKQNCKIFSLELEKHKLEELLEKYPQYKNIKFENKNELIEQIIEGMATVINGGENENNIVEELEDILESIDDNVKGTFDDIKDIIYKMQCILRNEEGITGINAMHHQNLIILISALTDERCRKLNIPLEMSYENIKDLQEIDLYQKIYNPSNQRSCVLHHIRNAEIGFTKDLPFEIKKIQCVY